MSLKICLTAFVSTFFLAFPQNLIGCADTDDPHDYFTSFFSRDLNNTEVYRPFYYTSMLTFYDDIDGDAPVDYENDKVIQEWKQYCGGTISTKETVQFVYKLKAKDIKNISKALADNKTNTLPDSIQRNGMTQYFIKSKNTPALDYLLVAKSLERSNETWEVPVKKNTPDVTASKEIERYLTQTTDPFLKSKYTFLKCRLDFYDASYQECINTYDKYFTPATTAAVNSLALSYKAGSLFHLGKKKEAAYAFAKAFQLSGHNKKQNFLGFLWATDRCNAKLKEEYLSFAKTAEDKALLMALFSMHGMTAQTDELEAVYALYPSSQLLPLLTIREINKIEEQYLTPMLAQEEGKPFYYWWAQENLDTTQQKQYINSFMNFLEKTYKEGKAIDRDVYITGAAYLAFITKDFPKAKTLLKEATKAAATTKTKDQVQLINLLIAVNEQQTIDSKTETAILPSLAWLANKAKNDQAYENFQRNFYSVVLAPKYEQQKEGHKAALAYGIASGSLDYIQNEMETAELVKLNQTLLSPSSAIDQFLVKHTAITNEQVIDVIGTSYLRDHNFTNAIEWLSKARVKEPLVASNYNYTTDKETLINVNPLHDYLNDWQRYEKPVAKPYTKLSLAQKLLELQQKADTAQNTETKAKTYYQLASAFYNMSHYGNSWDAVAYYRSGADWNQGNYKTAWQKEYYGVYKAREYYQKAYTLSQDKEFKAAAYFLMAKCAQRQVPLPAYDYNNNEQYEKAQLAFERKFKNNALFPQFIKEFGTTKFYQYTYNRCSYLRDFVKQTTLKK